MWGSPRCGARMRSPHPSAASMIRWLCPQFLAEEQVLAPAGPSPPGKAALEGPWPWHRARERGGQVPPEGWPRDGRMSPQLLVLLGSPGPSPSPRHGNDSAWPCHAAGAGGRSPSAPTLAPRAGRPVLGWVAARDPSASVDVAWTHQAGCPLQAPHAHPPTHPRGDVGHGPSLTPRLRTMADPTPRTPRAATAAAAGGSGYQPLSPAQLSAIPHPGAGQAPPPCAESPC